MFKKLRYFTYNLELNDSLVDYVKYLTIIKRISLFSYEITSEAIEVKFKENNSYMSHINYEKLRTEMLKSNESKKVHLCFIKLYIQTYNLKETDSSEAIKCLLTK